MFGKRGSLDTVDKCINEIIYQFDISNSRRVILNASGRHVPLLFETVTINYARLKFDKGVVDDGWQR